MRHKLLKYELRYDLQRKISWHNDFKSFTDKLFPLQLKGGERKFPILKMKLNRINASVPVQVLFGGFRENDRFLKIFLSFSLENFTHSFNPSQNVSPILLFNNW